MKQCPQPGSAIREFGSRGIMNTPPESGLNFQDGRFRILLSPRIKCASGAGSQHSSHGPWASRRPRSSYCICTVLTMKGGRWLRVLYSALVTPEVSSPGPHSSVLAFRAVRGLRTRSLFRAFMRAVPCCFFDRTNSTFPIKSNGYEIGL
jgi:hypothetical protein